MSPEGGIRTPVEQCSTDLQSVAIGHSATSGMIKKLLYHLQTTSYNTDISFTKCVSLFLNPKS